MYKHLTIRLSLFILLFLFVKGQAQSCDENVLKGLERTRIYYHKEVTKDSNASFFIKNPLKGTTYSFIDKATGVAYSKLYTGMPEELTIEIPVGKVATEQSFIFRATNGDCAYQSLDNRDVNKRYYVITPNTQLKLSLSVEHEWCAHSGAVHMNMVGDDNANYNFFFKKPNGNFEQLAGHSYTSLDAGTYEVKAVNKNDNSKTYTQKVKIEKLTKHVDFQLSSVVDVCTGKIAIYVDTKKGKTGGSVDNSYPLFFTLLKNNVEIKNQTSPIFKDVEEGATYEVRVYDVCGTSGGNFSTQTYKVEKRLGVFKVINHTGFSPKANCPYMVSFTSELYVKDAREMVEKNLIPYPLAFTFEMTSPSNKVYHFSFVVNNKQELEENFTPTENSFYLRPLKLSNNNISYEVGKWKLKGTYTICGKQNIIPEAEKEVFLPITGVGIGIVQDDFATNCRNQKLVLTNSKSNQVQNLKNFYTVLENAPAGFDYQAAGFYKITTTNPLLQNKWVKFFENTDGKKTLLPAKFIEEGGDYKFKVVDECTNTTKDLSYTGYATSQGRFELKAKVYGTCSDPSGAPDNNSLWKEVVLERGNTTDGTITKVEIISYEKDSRFADYSALMPITLPIDITETYRSGEQQWRIKLPAGIYNVRWSGSCNKTETLKVQTGGPENTIFEWQDGCNPKLIVKRNTSYSLAEGIEYTLERYDTKENRWASVTYGYYGGDTFLDGKRDRFEFNIPSPQQGKYRVLRSIQPNSTNRLKECTRVVAEHEFTEGEMQQPRGVRMDCSAIGGTQKYHIVIIPQGGVPPYTYELSEAEIDGSTTNSVYQNNADNNFFINVDASKPQARYKFLVKDSCGKGKVYEETLSQIAPFAVQKNQEFYCVGSKGVLSVPQISGVSYQWYRNDQPTTVLSTSNQLIINNLTQADLDNTFSLKLTLTNITDPTVKSCIEQNLNGFDTIRFNTHTPYSQTYKAPIAVNRVECLEEKNNSVNNIYDVNKLFKDVPTSFEAGVSYDIIDKDGLISTTRMDYLGLKDMIKMSPALVGKHTFIYRIKSACGSVITQTEATLEVKTYKQIYATSINVCEATKTLAELETIIKNTNTGITASMFGNNFEFQWYPTSVDAINETNRITTPSLSLSEGNNQYYIKGKHIGDSFCFSSPAQVNIMRLSSSSKGDKTITLCEGTTITDLKKEIAKPSTSDVNKVAVYKGTTLLSNDDLLQTGIQYTYTYKVGTCETPSANINLTLTPITSILPVESLVVCDYEVENLSYYTTYAVVMNYLQTKYAGKTVKLYQSFGPYNIPQVQPTDKIFLNTDRFSYTLQEAGKCESVRQKIIVVADINRAIATTVAISVCEEDKVSAIRAKLIGDNIKIYKKLRTSSQNAVLSTEVNDNEDIDWTEGIEYFYTIKNTGDTCESRKERIYLSKSLGGKTLAQPVSLSLCNSNATIGDLKVALQGNEVKIYTLNAQNKYVEEAEATVLNAATTYYYTLRDIGKCVSEKAPITFTLLQRPVTPTVTQTTQSFCSNATIASLQPQGANIIWYATATSTTPLANTTPLVAGNTYYVAQRNGSCESARAVVNVIYSNTLSLTVPAPLTIACDDANIATTVGNWLNQATVTDTCGTATLTHNYTAVKPTDWCNTSIVTITFVGKDPLGNTVTKTSTIKVLQIDAVDDTHTGIINGANGANDVIDVLQNDRVGETQATTSNVQLTVVTPATGGTNVPTLNTATGKISVPAGTKSGTYTIQYKICHTENSITVCDTATITVKVGSTPIVAKADTYTITNGTSTTTTTGTVLDNDKLGTKTPTTTDVILTVVTTTTDVVGATKTPTLNNNGTVTVPSGTRSGTYQIVYSICERLNPDNCATATATVKVGSTPIVAKADTYTITNGTSTTTTTGTVLDNDKLGTKTPTTTDVILTVVTTTTDVVGATKTPTLKNNGTVTVPSGTKSGTYEIVYSICERLNPDNCATATATVKVFVPTVVTPTTIEAVNDGVTTITSIVGGTTPSVLTNDKLNGVPNPSISSVTLTWNTATPTGFTLNPNGTITVAPNTPVGIHTISYTICAVASPTVCSTASIVVTVSGTTTSTTPVLPIAVDDRSTTTINTPVVVNVLGNDTPNGATTPNVVATPANGTVVVNVDGSIEYRPNTNFEGTDTFVYKLCNTDGCASATVTVDVVNKIVPYNGMSVNGDGKNDYFHIGGIERYPNNVVRIYNRWGVKVFESEGYDNVTRVFRGISNGRVTIEQADKLPQGTYYYVIEYYDSNNNKESLVGWLYIKK
ncbi:hypothetical protein Coch_1618 [Capnocytophaga ochracea DSM 7271]|uniref:Gliding motility-associated C-terminal domain n=1 Tax=Capnocytophaga ochracea (strain ATCC 27872 / DSM 7271 / CCUG 9716 / JCM 12966 / NCTC 12371 / SS31 / VPI 2845) TaxID=521097 RepID=C7M783_CAPOD|nr:gliding motility-associated C-terminal domain-containing protein [Capnocytophaga ochracea]ACU93163.1 hypothetical protein Coch_1618 [Capnocytophaga ochracea DSM 7271]UAK51858.1 gliding motility-associated C-terminal domain-containing protein [Capnocytophaga ochracea]